MAIETLMAWYNRLCNLGHITFIKHFHVSVTSSQSEVPQEVMHEYIILITTAQFHKEVY